MKKDQYDLSWELYIAHSSSFADDLKYYADFTKGFSSLEIFAGYGRVTNHLASRNNKIEALDLNPNFLSFISLPENKKHLANVTDFNLNKKFDRIFAAYNSFCLLQESKDILSFFNNLANHMHKDSLVSLNYYHTNEWSKAVSSQFEFKGQTVNYHPSFSLKMLRKKKGIWTDLYEVGHDKIKFDYHTRIYLDKDDLIPYLIDSNLEIIDEVHNFNSSAVSEPGWIDYIIRLK